MAAASACSCQSRFVCTNSLENSVEKVGCGMMRSFMVWRSFFCDVKHLTNNADEQHDSFTLFHLLVFFWLFGLFHGVFVLVSELCVFSTKGVC